MNERPFVLRGIREISAQAGINWKMFGHFVHKKGLPVWRYEGTGPYLSLVEDINQWLRDQRDKYLNQRTL